MGRFQEPLVKGWLIMESGIKEIFPMASQWTQGRDKEKTKPTNLLVTSDLLEILALSQSVQE